MQKYYWWIKYCQIAKIYSSPTDSYFVIQYYHQNYNNTFYCTVFLWVCYFYILASFSVYFHIPVTLLCRFNTQLYWHA